MNELLQRYCRTVKHVQFVLRTERSGNLLTTNHYFSENLDKFRSERDAEQDYDSYSFDPSNATQKTHVGNMKHIIRDIHDILRSYYKVARKRFTDNICMQETDYHLIMRSDTSLCVLSSRFVVNLFAEQLEAMTEEDIMSIRRRKTIERKIESLSKKRLILTT